VATLFKDKNSPNWYVLFGNHKKSTGTSNRKRAKEVLKKFEDAQFRERMGLDPEPEFKSILLSQFIALYLADRRKLGKSPETIRTDEYCLKRLLIFTEDVTLSEITGAVALRYRNWKLESVKPATASIELRSIRAAFNWALDKPGEKYLRKNPFSQKGMVPVVNERRMPTFLMPTEKAAFLAAIDRDDYRRLFHFLLLTGCRRGEAINLSWADVNLEQRSITFRMTKTRRDRSVPITLELMQIIMALDRNQPKPFNWDPDWISRLFKRYLEKAGIKRNLHLHCLRHTAATDLVRAGIHPNKIKEFLGHSSLKVTEIYTHILPEDLREAAEALTCLG
jgi:integrase